MILAVLGSKKNMTPTIILSCVIFLLPIVYEAYVKQPYSTKMFFYRLFHIFLFGGAAFMSAGVLLMMYEVLPLHPPVKIYGYFAGLLIGITYLAKSSFKELLRFS